MGTGGLSVPIALLPGRDGSTPQLSLGYSSGNGLFGVGWSVALPSVRRRTDKQLPTYDDASDRDTFLLVDAEELVPALRNEGSYSVPSWTPHVAGDRTA